MRGEAVVAGVGLDTMVNTIFLYLFSSISAGGAVVVAQYLGRKDREKGNLAASQIFPLAGVVSLLCMGLMLLFGSALLELLYPSTEAATMAACKTYLWIVALSFPAKAVYNAGAAILRTMGKTILTLKVSLLANLVNVAGNAVGIFVLHAGAAGVAWPTTLSWYLAAMVMTALCFREEQEVRIEWRHMLRFEFEMSRRILGVAIPNSIENTLFQAAKVVLGVLIATLGTSQIAANTTGQTIWSLAACMGSAMSAVFITVIGQCVGARDLEAAEWYMRRLSRLSVVLALFCAVVCRTLLSFLLAKWMGMGVIGIALAMVLDWCIKAVLDIRRFQSGKWKNKCII